MARCGLFVVAGLAVGIVASAGLAQNRVLMNDAGAMHANGFAGGAFRAEVRQGYIGVTGGVGGTADSFLTFCLERGRQAHLGQTSYAEIGDRAISGGGDRDNNGPGDPLSQATMILYSRFRNDQDIGTRADRRVNSAEETRALQIAMWYLEDEYTALELINPWGEYNQNTLAQNYVNWAIAQAAVDTTDYGVRVLSLWSAWGPNGGHGDRQDQLTIIPLPPAAWAGLGSLAGVMAIGYVRRRKQLS